MEEEAVREVSQRVRQHVRCLLRGRLALRACTFIEVARKPASASVADAARNMLKRHGVNESASCSGQVESRRPLLPRIG